MLTTLMIGNKIAEARKKMNISQSQLAEHLFISSQAVGKWERGESMPDIITINRLAEILGVDLNYFSENFKSAVNETAQPAPLVNQPVETASEKKQKKPGIDMSRGNWQDADFSGLKNLNEKFSSSNMQRCLFTGSDMSGLLLKSNNIESCDFSDSDISNSYIRSSFLSKNTFKLCSLKESEFSASYISGCDFSGADLSNVVIKSGGFEKNIITNAVLNNTSFINTQISDIIFDGTIEDCHFENCSFTRVTFQNATLTNTFFKCKSLKKIQFIECVADKLTYAFLKNGKADLSGITVLAS